MPKSVVKIDRFEGGMNQHSDSRDIADNEASSLIDAAIHYAGKVQLTGGSVPFIKEIEQIQIREPGWGLFTFQTDYDIVDTEELGGLRGGSYIHPDLRWGVSDEGLKGTDSIGCLMKLFDPFDEEASNTLPQIVVREDQNEDWTHLGESLFLYENELHVKEPINQIFEYTMNAVRIADAKFKQFGSFTKWFGIVN